MTHQTPHYTMITRQRRKSGCLAGMFHLVAGMLTLGVWPLLVWLAHRIGPGRRQVTHVYADQPPQLLQPSWQWDPYTQQWQWHEPPVTR